MYNLSGPGLQGTYSGNGYPASGCGYSAAELQHAYGFDTVISGGIDGTGEIIVILDAYGSATITQDAQTYSVANGLRRSFRALTSSSSTTQPADRRIASLALEFSAAGKVKLRWTSSWPMPWHRAQPSSWSPTQRRTSQTS